MSMFERDDYRWRETYFVLFDAAKRPSSDKVQQLMHSLNERFQLGNVEADESGAFESLTLLSPDDYAALDISYLEGVEVIEHAQSLVEDLKATADPTVDKERLARLRKCNARFDVMHFEQVLGPDPDEVDEMFDPSALLVVLEALSTLTDGIAVDPQGGTML